MYFGKEIVLEELRVPTGWAMWAAGEWGWFPQLHS